MIENPAKDSKLRASWGSSVADAINRHEAALGERNAKAANPRGTVAQPFPFMVVGGTVTANGTNREQFVIYLPDGCIVDGSTTYTPTGITAMRDNPNRYTIDSENIGTIGTSTGTASTLYLVVHTSSGTLSVTSATFMTSLDNVPQGHTVNLALPVATIFKQTKGTGANAKTYGCVAQQLVRSSVVVSSGSGTGGGSGGSTSGYTGTKDVPYAFDGPRSDGKLYAKTKTWTFQNGLLQSVSTEDGTEIVVADTIAHSGI